MTESSLTAFERALQNHGPDAKASAELAERGLVLRLIDNPEPAPGQPEPAPTIATVPTNSTEPSDPTAPTAPADPTAPTAPTDPTAPTAPSNPAAPTNSTIPTDPLAPLPVHDWFRSVSRGFLDANPDDDSLKAMTDRTVGRRNIGVFDPSGPQPELPVGTYGTFVTELSVPGEKAIPAFAVTAVTVAATHRRRGIARQMMEGELRAAVAVGLPVAVLTVSESSIYQRYGFAPAANAATWVIDRKRAGFTGPQAEGRVDYLSKEQFRELAPELHERVRRSSPGEIIPTVSHWDTTAGTRPDHKTASALRFVQYRDAAGVVQGLAVYSLGQHPTDYTKTPMSIGMLITATDDAYAGLWRYFLEHDLIGEITLDLRAADEPVRWMIADQRAAKVTVIDHQYVRILNVKQALESRTYGSAGRVVLDVADPLGIDGGRFVLEVDEAGNATVEATEEDADARLTTVELSALFIGGTSAQTLVSAGRMTAGDVASLDAMFRTATDPRLSFWY